MNKETLFSQTDSVIPPSLIFVCGASAVGKTTLAKYSVDYLQSRGIGAKMPVSYTTRDMRDDEIDGVDYHFITGTDFETEFLPQIESDPKDWDLDYINNNYYFNRYSSTAPDEECPVSILPISLSVCQEMVAKYGDRYPGIAIGVVAVLLGNSNTSEWEKRMTQTRPTRDILAERTQNDMYMPLPHVPCTNLVPTWHLEVDAIQFIRKLPLEYGV